MFTGIIAAIGKIQTITPLGQNNESGVRLHIDAGNLPMNDIALGDSIAIEGACMTVVEKTNTHFTVDVSAESLSKTVGLNTCNEVNLEKALTLADRLGGHLVTGHIDGLGQVTEFKPIGESWLLTIKVPNHLGKFLAYKGSVTVNGTSLTVNKIHDEPTSSQIFINLIPHTIENTTLKHLHIGKLVNLEIDLIARYCERLLSHPKSTVGNKPTE